MSSDPDSSRADLGPLRTEGPRELLIAMVALDLRLIDRSTLMQALTLWRSDVNRTLGQVLVEQGWLSPKHEELLEALVDAQPQDRRRAPASFAAPAAVSAPLESLAISDLGATLHIPTQMPGSHSAADQSSVSEATDSKTQVWTSSQQGQVGALRYSTQFIRERLFAEGGLGQIWLCEQEEPIMNRKVAVKQLRPSIADDLERRQQFEFEARVTSCLEHPNIVPVYALGRSDDGRPYYAMRFIHGELLRERIAEFHNATRHVSDLNERDVDLRKLLQQFVSVCDTIQYAHSRGVLHRDIKPENIKIGKYGQVVVLDWGLALPFDPKRYDITSDEPSLAGYRPKPLEHAEEGRFLGTPGYASPEQAAGKVQAMGPRCDVYSLGATLYCMLTGVPPIHGDRTTDVILKAQRGEFARPREVNPRIPKELEAICLKAMAFTAEKRYATARALASDIEHWLADAPVTALAESLWQRTRRVARHHKTATITGLATLLVVGISVSVMTLIYSWLAQERLGRQQAFHAIEEALFPGDSQQRLMENLNPSVRLQDKYESIVGEEYLRERRSDPYLARVSARLAQLPHPFARTMKFFDEADRYYQDLLIAQPNNLDFLSEYAALLIHRGSAYRDHRDQDESRRDLNAAIERLKQLVAKHPQPKFEQLLARAYHELASLLAGEGKHDQLVAAESFYLQSRQIRQDLAARYPGQAGLEYRHELAMSDGWLGDLYLSLCQFDKAKQAYQDSLALRKQLHDEAPDNWERTWQLGRAYMNYVTLYADYGDPRRPDGDKAQLTRTLDDARKARGLQMQIVGDAPANIDYRSDLGFSDSCLADILIDLGQATEATPYAFASLEQYMQLMHHDPDNPRFHSSLARSHVILAKLYKLQKNDAAMAGALTAATDELKRVVTEPGSDGQETTNPSRLNDDDFLTRAQIHALRAEKLTGEERTTEIAQANDDLAEWHERGLKGAWRLERDTGFDSLRNEPRFKQLVEQLNAQWRGESK